MSLALIQLTSEQATQNFVPVQYDRSKSLISAVITQSASQIEIAARFQIRKPHSAAVYVSNTL